MPEQSCTALLIRELSREYTLYVKLRTGDGLDEQRARSIGLALDELQAYWRGRVYVPRSVVLAVFRLRNLGVETIAYYSGAERLQIRETLRQLGSKVDALFGEFEPMEDLLFDRFALLVSGGVGSIAAAIAAAATRAL